MGTVLLAGYRPELILSVIIGLALLTFGRRLFWIFVGAAGFVVGMQWGASILGNQSEVVILVFALALGVIGAFAMPPANKASFPRKAETERQLQNG